MKSDPQRPPLLEIIVCLGPTLMILPTGLLVVPHQLQFVFGEGRVSSLWTVYWYLGTAALVLAVRAMYVFVRDNRRILPAIVVQSCLGCGLLALAIGPTGTFALGGNVNAFGWIFYVVLPLTCVVRLAIRSRDYVLSKRVT